MVDYDTLDQILKHILYVCTVVIFMMIFYHHFIYEPLIEDVKNTAQQIYQLKCDERIKRLKTDIVDGLGEMAWHELH